MTLAKYFKISTSSSASRDRCSALNEMESEPNFLEPATETSTKKTERCEEQELKSPPIKRQKFTDEADVTSLNELEANQSQMDKNYVSAPKCSQSQSSQSQSSEGTCSLDDSVTSSEGKSRRRRRCGNCPPCLAEDCEVCIFCKDKKKFGGPGRQKQACVNRKCEMIADQNSSGDSTSSSVKQKSLSHSPLLKCFNKMKQKSDVGKTILKSPTEDGGVENITYKDFIKQVKTSDLSSTPSVTEKKKRTEIIKLSSGSSVQNDDELKHTQTLCNGSRPRTPLSAVESLRDDHSNLKRDKTLKHDENLELYTTLSHIGYIDQQNVCIELPKPLHWTTKPQLTPLKPSSTSFTYSIDKTDESASTLKNFFYQSKQCKKSTLNTKLSELSKCCPKFRARGAYNMLKTCRASGESADIWTSVYNPRSREMMSILGNDMEVLLIENWLSEWTDSIASSGNHRKFEKRKCKVRQDSSSEDEGEGQSARTSVLLISGPYGVGKSACVHMIAQKLKYKVFEVNSSTLRTSRTVYEQFHESTQSQRVVNKQTPTLFFKSTKPSKSRTLTEELNGQVSLSKLSLILFDEVDVVFEADKGFYEAVQKLEQEARKPIIMTASNEWILHYLPKLDVLHVRLNPPQPDFLCHYLTLMSVVEGNRPNTERMREILNRNSQNIQQSIHQLQFEQLALKTHQTSPHKTQPTQLRELKFDMKDELRKIRHKSFCDLLSRRKLEPHFTNRICFTVPGIDDTINAELYNKELSDLAPYYTNIHSNLEYQHAHKIRDTRSLVESLDRAHVRFVSPYSFSFLSDQTIVTDYLQMLKCMSHAENIRRAMSRKKRRFTHHFDRVGLYLPEMMITKLAERYDEYLQNIEPELRADDPQTINNREDNSQSEFSDTHL